jgi:hypothetical protein
MKRKVSIFLVVAGFVAILSSQALLTHAQEQKSQYFLVYEACVHPSKAADFAKAARAEVALYGKYKFPYAWEAYSTFDGHFYFIIAVDNFADIDKVFAGFDKVAKDAGKEYEDLLDMFAGTYQFVRPQVFMLDLGLSLVSEDAAPDPEATGIFWDIHYVHGGMDAEYEENVKAIQSLFKSKGIVQNWYCYKAVMGEETPMYYFVTSAKGPVDFYTTNNEMWAKVGDEATPYYQKFIKLLRKREEKRGWYRKGLSYTPPDK